MREIDITPAQVKQYLDNKVILGRTTTATLIINSSVQINIPKGYKIIPNCFKDGYIFFSGPFQSSFRLNVIKTASFTGFSTETELTIRIK